MVSRLLILLAALLPCAGLLWWYLRRFGSAAEPARRVVMALGLGAAAFGVAVAMDSPDAGGSWHRAFVRAAPREELLKLAAALLAAPRPRRMERFSAGITYLVAAAVGFAAAENVAYGWNHGLVAALARGVTAVPAHVLHSAMIGVAIGRVHRLSSGAWAGVAAAGLAAILAHGLYDLLLLEGGAGRFGIIGLLTLEGVVVLVSLIRARRGDQARDLDELSRVPLFEGAEVAMLRLLAEGSRRRFVRAGGSLVQAGDAGAALFVIERGSVRTERQGWALNTLSAGQVFGEAAVLSGDPWEHDVVARVDSLLLEVPRDVVLEAIASTDGLAEVLLARARARGAEGLPSDNTLADEAQRAQKRRDAHLLTDDAVQRLSRVGLLADAPKPALASMAQRLDVLECAAGEQVVAEGHDTPGLCIVLEGAVQLRQERTTLATLGEGEWFGEIHVLTGLSATLEVVAGPRTQLAVLDWDGLRGAVGLHPELGIAILETLLRRVEELDEDTLGRSALSRLLRMVDGSALLHNEVQPDSTIASVMGGLATHAHLDLASLRALTVAVKTTTEPVWALDEAGLRALRGGGLRKGERGLGRGPLLDALARSPELLRVLASQAVQRAI